MKLNNRILIVDDYPEIHNVMKASITRATGSKSKEAQAKTGQFEIDSAYQGKEGYDMALAAKNSGKPYALIFMDMKMPPGWDGLETTRKILAGAPQTEIVIMTAYSEFSAEQIFKDIGSTEHLHLIHKPFSSQQIKDLAERLVEKWNLNQQQPQDKAVA